jgi:glutamine synthetase type III
MRFLKKITAEDYVPWLNEATEAAMNAILEVYKKKTGKKLDTSRADKLKKKMQDWAEEEVQVLWN